MFNSQCGLLISIVSSGIFANVSSVSVISNSDDTSDNPSLGSAASCAV